MARTSADQLAAAASSSLCPTSPDTAPTQGPTVTTRVTYPLPPSVGDPLAPLPLQALAQQAQAIEDYMAAGGDEAVEERPMAAPVDPYADIDPELLGGEVLSVSCRGWLCRG